jgi:hypothetical protein
MISVISSCFTTTQTPDSIKYNYKQEGFLDKNHFQILAHGIPDTGLKSLVEKRESALRNAEKTIQSKYLHLLKEYYLSNKLPGYSPVTFHLLKHYTAIQKDLNDRLSEYPGYGVKICEYYNEDASAVIVHRISRNNLQSDILGISIDFEHKENKNKK